MIHVFTKNITRNAYLLPSIFVSALLMPLTVMADPKTLSCTDARRQIEHTLIALRPLEQHQQQLQQYVRIIYQKLFACQARAESSLAQRQECTQLQKEGPAQFQALVEAVTLSHETSQQLAHQTRQAQLVCPAVAEDTFPKTTNLPLLQKIARNN